MTTFEEEIVDVYYNLNGYFTMKNIPFSTIEKRKGGKGRGEIDILAIKIKDDKVIDCIHIEVSVSITSLFPFTTKGNSVSDESGKIIKKFFSNDSDEKIKELIGNTPCQYYYFCSDFHKNVREKLKARIPYFGGEILDLVYNKKMILLKVKYKDKIKLIQIWPFTTTFFNLLKLFQQKGLILKHFQDSRLRSIQHFLHIMKKRDRLMELWKQAKKDLKEDL